MLPDKLPSGGWWSDVNASAHVYDVTMTIEKKWLSLYFCAYCPYGAGNGEARQAIC
jgi:hypothetical protein